MYVAVTAAKSPLPGEQNLPEVSEAPFASWGTVGGGRLANVLLLKLQRREEPRLCGVSGSSCGVSGSSCGIIPSSVSNHRSSPGTLDLGSQESQFTDSVPLDRKPGLR